VRSRRSDCANAAAVHAHDLLRSIDGLVQQNRPEANVRHPLARVRAKWRPSA
jgi:hypothetical protein